MFARPFLAAILLGAGTALATIPAASLAAPYEASSVPLSASTASITTAAIGAGPLAEAVTGHGWRPLSLKGCGLAIGAFLGAVTASTANPLLIGLVGSAAFHAALYACT